MKQLNTTTKKKVTIKLVASLMMAAGLGAPAQASIIAVQPPGSIEPNFWPTDPGSQRWQQDYSSSFFGVSPFVINAFSFYDSSSAGPISYSTFSIVMSTTTVAPGSLSTTYAANVGANATTVLSGPMTISDVGGLTTFNLTTPFVYDPSQGNLLIDIEHSAAVSGNNLWFVSYSSTPTGLLERISNVPDAPTGVNYGFGELQTQFNVNAVPEPATLALAGLGGLASLVAFRRRK